MKFNVCNDEFGVILIVLIIKVWLWFWLIDGIDLLLIIDFR